MAVIPGGAVFAQGHRYGAPHTGRWRAASSFQTKIAMQVPSLSPNQHRLLLAQLQPPLGEGDFWGLKSLGA